MKSPAGTNLVVALVLPWAQAASGQTDKEFEEWQKKEQASFQQFQEARDREFVGFLKKEWKEWQSYQGIRQDTIPKPLVMPVAPAQVSAPEQPAEEAVEETPPPETSAPVVTGPLPLPPPETPQPPVEKTQQAVFVFFGTDLPIEYDPALVPSLPTPVDQEVISDSWEALSRADYPGFLSQAQHYREQMRLNDWGYFQLLDSMAEAICKGAKSQCRLLVWFMLSKSGYEVKIGYDKERVYLLFTAKNSLYGVPYFSLDDKRFYLVSVDGKGEPVEDLFTYEGHYPGADHPLDLRLASLPDLKGLPVDKTLAFHYEGNEYQIPVRLDRSIVAYLDAYPQTEYEVYFTAPPSAEAGRALLSELQPLVAGTTEKEAVNRLLRFVQTAFGYQTDDEQFGREKPLFPEETLYYPFSDCEDRAVLFSFLVRNLLGLRIIGLDYPGHVATAVRFSGEAAGDYVVYENEKYTVCDPTYINAEAGMTMPQVKGLAPLAIPVGF